MKVLSALESSDGKYISGSFLAEKIGVSRNAVWKAVNSLRNEGFRIDAISNNGYRLIKKCSPVYERGIQKHLNTSSFGKKIVCFKEIDSTNSYARKLAYNGEKNGTTVIAECQTEGRGRMGRSFESPSENGIYMSVIVKIPFSPHTSQLITACTAVAVSNAIDKVCRTDTKIKWVNDIFLNNRKICGILTEASMNFESYLLEYAVIGIGINVYSVKNKFSNELLEKVTSIEDEIGLKADRCELCGEILNNLEKELDKIESKEFIEEYRKRSCIIGKEVIVSKGNTERHAYAYNIDDNACLEVRYDNGEEEPLYSGEARIINAESCALAQLD